MALKKVWAEEYRPRKIDDMVFANERERNIFKKMVAEKYLPNLLLVGVQGTGKTTLSEALVRELGVHEEDVIKLNCAEKQIEAIRDDVTSFAYTMPMGEFKVVRLEEMDYLSASGQALLRSLQEEVGDSCRFIATANYANKIIPPMRSRFQEFVFSKPDRDGVLLRMAEILEKEKIEFEVDDLDMIVSAGYPDIRKTLQLLESGSSTGKLAVASASEKLQDWKLQLLPMLESNDLDSARTLVATSATKEELVDVYAFLHQNLHRIKKLQKNQHQAIILIAQYQFQHQFVSDGALQIDALFCELLELE